MKDRTYIILDLFSGAGGFSEGFLRAGFKIKKHFYSEIDKHAIACYKHNFKNSEYVGSVTDVQGITDRIKQYRADKPECGLIITFGSPCQDFSLAGKRAGMDGERSSLISRAIEIISIIRPDVFIWENVKGAFSSNSGADFWAIIQAFTDLRYDRLEWQLLNTAWLLPQNRERIYLVGHLGEGSGRNVFPIGEDFERIDEVSKGISRTANTRTLSAGGKSGGLHSDMTLIKIASATNSGYEEATEGDSINLSQPNSETRRGRVGKGKAQTLETSCNQAVIQDRIRRLTEIETERLQGFKDDHTKYGNYDGEVKEISRTQRYKLMGNAISVPIVELIANRL